MRAQALQGEAAVQLAAKLLVGLAFYGYEGVGEAVTAGNWGNWRTMLSGA